MTQEEYNAEMAERQRLIDECNSLIAQINYEIERQAELQAELDTLVYNMGILANNISAAGNAAAARLQEGVSYTGNVDEETTDLYYVIDTVATSYFRFKEMSTASKNVSEATDEYHTKFKEYHLLRRIVMGYVIGLDQNFASKEHMRKVVEKIYLQNSDYWLAYAAAAVMLWASNEQEAAKRAVGKAVFMDYNAASVFFLLINLRFTRTETAKRWYLTYLDRVDMDHLGREWEQLLETYLSGVFGVDPAFSDMVQKCFADMFAQLESTHPTYGTEIADKTAAYADHYLHVTNQEFENIRRYCPEYKEMKYLLSTAEKNAVLTEEFRGFWDAGEEQEDSLYERVEDILYDLIKTPGDKEDKVLKKIDLNKKILQAKGDVSEAQRAFNHAHAAEETTTLADLLFSWGFAEGNKNVDVRVRQFSLRYLKKHIARGFRNFAENYRVQEKESYVIDIDGWSEACDENSFNKSADSLIKHHTRNRVKDLLGDKYVMIFAAMLVASLAALVLCVVSFNKVVLTAGILLGVAGGFLLWRRVADLNEILNAKLEKCLLTLDLCIQEIGQWRDLYKKADAQNEDLVTMFENIDVL